VASVRNRSRRVGRSTGAVSTDSVGLGVLREDADVVVGAEQVVVGAEHRRDDLDVRGAVRLRVVEVGVRPRRSAFEYALGGGGPLVALRVAVPPRRDLDEVDRGGAVRRGGLRDVGDRRAQRGTRLDRNDDRAGRRGFGCGVG
jgi:hypothetical protein